MASSPDLASVPTLDLMAEIKRRMEKGSKTTNLVLVGPPGKGVRTIVDVSAFLLSPVTMLVKAASDVAGAVVQRL